MQSRILLAMACFVAVGGHRMARAEEPRVGPLGEPARLLVRGVRSVPPLEVAQALFADLDVAYASFPVAPLRELERLLVEKSVLGFQHIGFPAPRVTIANRLDHLELIVDEGPRWVAGEIRVSGTKAVDARKLVAALLPDRAARTRASTQSASRWPVGQPARLDEPSRQALSKRVEELLAQQGYINAQSIVQVAGDYDRRTAALVVVVRHEGEPARIRDIELESNKIHTREQMFAWLRLPADAVLSTELCEEIERRLKGSGRFIDCAFSPAAHATRPRLRVDEFTPAPRLDQPLSREEEALLKLAAWVGAFDKRGDDLVIKRVGLERRPETVFSPRHAFVMKPLDYSRKDRNPTSEMALVCSEDQISISSALHGRKLVIDCAADAFLPRVAFTLVHHDDGECAFGAGFDSGRGGTRLYGFKGRKPERAEATIGPVLTAASALSIVCKHRARCTWDGPILTAQWTQHRLRLDSRDGRLIDLEDGEGHRLFFRAGDKYNWGVKPGAGQFAQKSAEIARATANFTNVADSRRLFSSTMDFVCGEVVDHDRASRGAKKLATAIGHLADHGAFRPIDDLLFAAARDETNGFLIPQTSPSDTWNLRFGSKGVQYGKPLAVSWADELFARGSRPWLTYREATFVVNGKSEHKHERLARLFPDGQRGPITTLVLAEAMLRAGMKADAADWARRGLEQVTLDAFRRDYADLLVPGSRIPDYVLTTAAAIRELDRDQINKLMSLPFKWHWLSRGQRFLAVFFANELRRDASLPTPAAVGTALDRLWVLTLEKDVTKRLEAILTAAEPAKDQPQARRGGLFLR